MRKIILTLLGLCLLTACGANHGSSTKLAANVSLYSPEEMAKLVDMQLLAKADVLDSLRMMQKSFALSYIGYNLKKELIGKSGDEIFAKCLQQAEAGPDRMTTSQLYDFALNCIAGFKDSHLSLTRLMEPGMVTSVISGAQLINDKLYVSSIRPNLIKKIEEVLKIPPGEMANKIELGSEIVSIDGSPAIQAVRNLQKYVGKSSPAAEVRAAAKAFFTRNFSYPEKKGFTVKIRNLRGEESEFALPWILHTGFDSSIETRIKLSEKGIVPIEKLFENKDGLMVSKNLSFATPIYSDLAAKRTFFDSDEDQALVIGLKTINKQTICYMQLNTFSFKKSKELGYEMIEKIDDTKQTVSLKEVVKNFVSSCEHFKASFVFDLRENGGGNPKIADILYDYFETTELPATYQVSSELNTSGNRAHISAMAEYTDLETTLTMQALKNSFDKKSQFSDWVAYKEKSEKSLFTGKLTVLISPACVSACDGFAERIKLSGRAKLFGTHTNGTGFGFGEYGTSTAKFQDHLKLYSVKLPNHAFQSVLVESDADFASDEKFKGKVFDFSAVKIAENRPTVADIQQEYTAKDLLDFSDYNARLALILDTLAPN